MFDKKGQITFDAAKHSEDAVMEVALEAGAEDVSEEDGSVTVLTEPGDFMDVLQAFEAAGFEVEESEVTMIPQNYIDVDVDAAKKIFRLVDALEENEDVQKVHINADFPDEALEELE
jgi:transcriptional/translational regulatory protein YebC/TACO1